MGWVQVIHQPRSSSLKSTDTIFVSEGIASIKCLLISLPIHQLSKTDTELPLSIANSQQKALIEYMLSFKWFDFCDCRFDCPEAAGYKELNDLND